MFVRKQWIGFVPVVIIFAVLFLAPFFVLAIGPIADLTMSTTQFGRDLLILVLLAYYLSAITFIIASWIAYYYNILVVSDERVVEISQNGLFNRSVNELVFEQVEDVSSIVKGMINTIFDLGTLDIQTAGPQRNFVIKDIGRVNDIVAIILDLSSQAKKGIKAIDRMPSLATVGIIGSRLVAKTSNKLPIMNFEMHLKEGARRHSLKIKSPKTLREKFDYWWWTHCNQMNVSFGNGEYGDETKQIDTSVKSVREEDSQNDKKGEMIDL